MATILQIMNADRNLSLFSRGLKITGLEDKLNENGPFTIFGPVNLALNRLQTQTFDQLLEPANRNDLFAYLSGYIISGKKMMYEFRHDQKLQTLDGREVSVSVKNGDTHINGARILSRDRQGSNGVIHLLDKTYEIADKD